MLVCCCYSSAALAGGCSCETLSDSFLGLSSHRPTGQKELLQAREEVAKGSLRSETKNCTELSLIRKSSIVRKLSHSNNSHRAIQAPSLITLWLKENHTLTSSPTHAHTPISLLVLLLVPVFLAAPALLGLALSWCAALPLASQRLLGLSLLLFLHGCSDQEECGQC